MEEENGLANTLSDLTILTQTLITEIKESSCESEDVTHSLVLKHLDYMNSAECVFEPLCFPSDMSKYDWFNVKEPLDFVEDLHDCIVVLDFFTYCCINCLHILPDLEALEEKFKPNESPVLVVGIHSAKFDNEKLSDCLLDAITRYNITHPVVNDVKCKLWHELGISCWPTLVILGPKNLPLFALMGEGQREILMKLVEETVEYYSLLGKLKMTSLKLTPFSLVPSSLNELSYPGKVNFYCDGLVISDSGNSRIILTDWNGNIKISIGSGTKGFKDGAFEIAQFNNPQGTAYDESSHVIYVADTNNHAVRKINLAGKIVETIAGNGSQGTDKEGGLLWTDQALSSPWDLCLCHSLDLSTTRDAANLLIIAMAGCHQIWGLFLSDGKWLKNMHYTKGTAVCLAGSGFEESRNTSYPLKAGFAQPSGVDVERGSEKQSVFIADSESSSVRCFSLADGSVKRVAGGSLDPMNLFVFGDVDGKGSSARFQHPLGVAVGQRGIYVADSYNHKIKFIEKKGKDYIVSTLTGTGEVGDACGSPSETKLNEPGGLAFHKTSNKLFIADTNNHCIKILDLKSHSMSKLELIHSPQDEETSDVVDSPERPPDISFVVPKGETQVFLHLQLKLPPGAQLTQGAKNKFKIFPKGENTLATCEGDVGEDILLQLHAGGDKEIFLLKCRLSLCLESGLCTMQELSKVISFEVKDTITTNDPFIVCIEPSL